MIAIPPIVRPTVNLVHVAAVTSTMDLLDELIADGAPDWTTVLADMQTAGLGRGGRAWQAEPGAALLCSILVRPRTLPLRHAGLVALATSAAVCQALDGFGVTTTVKWPNDVLLDGRKLAGILIRSRVDADGLVANVGIGLNLRGATGRSHERSALSEALTDVPDRAVLIDAVVERLATLLDGGRDQLIRAAWLQWAEYIGEPVVVVDGGRRVVGTMRGVDEYGAIEIEGPIGDVRSVTVGDLVRGPRPVDG